MCVCSAGLATPLRKQTPLGEDAIVPALASVLSTYARQIARPRPCVRWRGMRALVCVCCVSSATVLRGVRMPLSPVSGGVVSGTLPPCASSVGD